jgi:Helix-turn-helix domain
VAEFGRQLRQSRQAAALSLRQLAARVGYDHSYLSQVERGRRPGSAHLAQLCDRELGTGTALTASFRRTQTTPADTAPAVGGAPSQGGVLVGGGTWAVGGDCDVLEAARLGLAGVFGQAAGVEWKAVVDGYAATYATTPVGELLPQLTADVQLLRAVPRSGEVAGAVAEVGVLMGLTLAALGRVRAAARWWSTARLAADSSGEPGIAARVRAWEAWSAPAEGRPLPEALMRADEAATSALEPRDRARALGARARVLALLNRSEEARRTLHELQQVSESLRGTTALFEWPQYETDRVGSFVCTALGDTLHASVAQDRALAACPLECRRERAELELQSAECLIRDGEVATGLATAMRVLVELDDRWHTHHLYDVAGRALAAVQGRDAGRPAVRDYRELLRRRPYSGRTVGAGSSGGRTQG